MGIGPDARFPAFFVRSKTVGADRGCLLRRIEKFHPSILGIVRCTNRDLETDRSPRDKAEVSGVLGERTERLKQDRVLDSLSFLSILLVKSGKQLGTCSALNSGAPG